jgi:hypothetical protein
MRFCCAPPPPADHCGCQRWRVVCRDGLDRGGSSGYSPTIRRVMDIMRSVCAQSLGDDMRRRTRAPRKIFPRKTGSKLDQSLRAQRGAGAKIRTRDAFSHSLKIKYPALLYYYSVINSLARPKCGFVSIKVLLPCKTYVFI